MVASWELSLGNLGLYIVGSMRASIRLPSHILAYEAIFGERFRDPSENLWEGDQVVLGGQFASGLCLLLLEIATSWTAWWLQLRCNSCEGCAVLHRRFVPGSCVCPHQWKLENYSSWSEIWREPCWLIDSSLVLTLEPTSWGSPSLRAWELVREAAILGLTSMGSRWLASHRT